MARVLLSFPGNLGFQTTIPWFVDKLTDAHSAIAFTTPINAGFLERERCRPAEIIVCEEGMERLLDIRCWHDPSVIGSSTLLVERLIELREIELVVTSYFNIGTILAAVRKQVPLLLLGLLIDIFPAQSGSAIKEKWKSEQEYRIDSFRKIIGSQIEGKYRDATLYQVQHGLRLIRNINPEGLDEPVDGCGENREFVGLINKDWSACTPLGWEEQPVFAIVQQGARFDERVSWNFEGIQDCKIDAHRCAVPQDVVNANGVHGHIPMVDTKYQNEYFIFTPTTVPATCSILNRAVGVCRPAGSATEEIADFLHDNHLAFCTERADGEKAANIFARAKEHVDTGEKDRVAEIFRRTASSFDLLKVLARVT